MHNQDKPKTLYKFRSWSNPDKELQRNHMSLLTESKLWVPVATSLNDPFDCCIPFRYDLMEYEDFLESRMRNPPVELKGLSTTELSEQLNARFEKLGIFDQGRNGKVLLDLAKSYAAFNGVLSFATICDDPLLWSHYANSHKGYCVGFDYVKLHGDLDRFSGRTNIPFIGRRIDYVEQLPKIVPRNDDRADIDAYVRLLTTKSVHWEYEEEYRYVFSNWHTKGLEFDASSVSEIILGSEISVEDRTAIHIFAQKRFPSATVLQALKKPFSYELEFIPLE